MADVVVDFRSHGRAALVALYSHDRKAFQASGGEWIKHLIHQGLAQVSDDAGQFGGLIEGLAGTFTEQEAGELFDSIAAAAVEGGGG